MVTAIKHPVPDRAKPSFVIFDIHALYFPFGGLEETTRTSSNYVDEDYPVRPEIKQSLTG